MKSKLELLLAGYLRVAGLEYVEQHKPIPGRRFAFDFAIPDSKLLVEVQGGIWSRGKSGHKSGRGIERDTEKLNLAVVHGWRVLQVTEKQIRDGRALLWILQALGKESI